jgi:L-amino acid N-acyltransferase YncA
MIIRDATPADLVEITRIYADSVLNGVASYELVAPDEAEMERRMSAIRDSGYPYLVAEAATTGFWATPMRPRSGPGRPIAGWSRIRSTWRPKRAAGVYGGLCSKP